VVLDTQLPRACTEPEQRAFESAISVCASVSDWLARAEYVVDILAAGPDMYHLQAGRNLAFIEQILDILACVESGPSDGFDSIEPELRQNLQSIGSVICIFMDWNAARQKFAHTLRDLGTTLKVIVVRNGPCTLDPYRDQGWLGSVHVVSSDDVKRGIGVF